jgi:flagellar basal body-associated protein FliL
MNEAKDGQKEQAQATTAQGVKPPSNKILFLALVAVVIIFNGIIAFVLVRNTISKMNPKDTEEKAAVHGDSTESGADGEGGKKEHAKGGEEEEGGAVIEKPITVVTNIAGTDGTRFIRIEVMFGYNLKKYPKLAEEFEKVFAPKAKDALLDMLSQIPLEDLQRPDTKNELRRDLKRTVNELMPKKEGQVTEVYINDFIIQ